MPCPLYSEREQRCLLLSPIADADVGAAADARERVRPEWCAGNAAQYLNCPVFRQRGAERSKAD